MRKFFSDKYQAAKRLLSAKFAVSILTDKARKSAAAAGPDFSIIWPRTRRKLTAHQKHRQIRNHMAAESRRVNRRIA